MDKSQIVKYSLFGLAAVVAFLAALGVQLPNLPDATLEAISAAAGAVGLAIKAWQTRQAPKGA